MERIVSEAELNLEEKFKAFEQDNREGIIKLIELLKLDICDDYRCTDDPEDAEPGMTLTFSTNDDLSCWGYQTGDNSYTGGAYGLPHWAVTYLYRDSDAEKVYEEILNQWAELINI